MSYSLNTWHGCLQALRQYLRGWNMKKNGEQKTVKLNFSRRVEEIDVIAEERLLFVEEWEERISLEARLEEMLNWVELQWKQKVGSNWVLQGDANTHFFHQFVSGRRRKNTISFLDSDDGEIRGQKEITNHIVRYYKILFGSNEPRNIKLGDDFWPDNLKLVEEDRSWLVKPFSGEVIKLAIMDMKENSAPGPNGFGVSFLKKSSGKLSRVSSSICSKTFGKGIWILKDSIMGL